MRQIAVARPLIGDAEVTAVSAVLRSGGLAQGREVASFEEEFAAELTPGATAVAVSSGTAALHLGLLAAGIGPGDEVLVPSFTFAATANAVALTGAKPVFVDIEPDTFCMDPKAAEAAVSPRTTAMMPVHLYGHPADLTQLGLLASRHGLAVFEDAAQAHGATWQETHVGSSSGFGAFSLYPTKNMTSGEGGMVTSTDSHLVRKVRLLRNQGMEARYANEVVGFNARMTDVHAAIGRVQLKKVRGWNSTRQTNAAFLDTHLHGVGLPVVRPLASHVYHQYTVRIPEDRDGFAKALSEEHGIESGVYYPTPVHRLQSFGLKLDLPQTENAAREVLSLPVHPSVDGTDLERIVVAVNTLAGAGA